MRWSVQAVFTLNGNLDTLCPLLNSSILLKMLECFEVPECHTYFAHIWCIMSNYLSMRSTLVPLSGITNALTFTSSPLSNSVSWTTGLILQRVHLLQSHLSHPSHHLRRCSSMTATATSDNQSVFVVDFLANKIAGRQIVWVNAWKFTAPLSFYPHLCLTEQQMNSSDFWLLWRVLQQKNHFQRPTANKLTNSRNYYEKIFLKFNIMTYSNT